jgi:pentatricopeptide repeat protein
MGAAGHDGAGWAIPAVDNAINNTWRTCGHTSCACQSKICISAEKSSAKHAQPPPAHLHTAAVSFNALLEVCVRTEDTDRALDVIDRMADDGVDPDEMTIAVCSRKRQLRAYLRKRLA